MTLAEGLSQFYAGQSGAQLCAPGPCSLSHVRPNISRSMKVRPKDRQRAINDAKGRGVPTEFTAEGCPVFVSRDHQKRYRKAYDLVNHDGGYGD